MMVRTLLFHKHLKESQPITSDGWITLCHLEELECDGPTLMSLEEIKKKNDSVYSSDTESCYHHAVHLILENNLADLQKEEEQRLWKEKDKYLSVIRLHLHKTTNLSEQTEALTSHFEEFSKEYPDLLWKTYRTTELSDLVLVSTSKNLNQLSRWSLQSTNFHLIGRTYTYFCVPHSLLSDETKLNVNDTIDYFSLRFSIRSYKTASDELKRVQDIIGDSFSLPPSRITGNEDVIIYGTKVPVKNVVKLYRTWYQDNLHVLGTFSEIVSRIGTESTDSGSDATEEWRDSQLTEYCISLQQHMVDTLKRLNPSSEWKRPLTVLVNALVYMSRSPTLDESVYQILPGLVAFWKNTECNMLQECNEKLYLRTIELCVHMMEDLMRAEGQLSRQPEDRPIVYDIPIFFLECVTAFLQAVNRLFIDADGNVSEGHRFFLVPCAETDISTVELFTVSENAPGLLQIDIPFSWLYKPKRLMPALLHEAAHYVGEACRLRKKRFDLFLKGVCTEVVEHLFEPVTGSRENIQAFLKVFFEKELPAYISNISIREICDEVINIVEKLKYQKFFCEFVRKYYIEYQGTARFGCPSEDELEYRFEGFVSRINDLRILYRETYADACMLYLVTPEPEDYLSFVMDPERENWSTSTFLRIYIGLELAGYKYEAIINKVAYHLRNNPSGYEKAIKQLTDLHSLFVEEPNCAEALLKEYIHDCWKAFRDSYGNSDKYANIRSIYKEMISEKESFNHLKALDIIDDSRQHILKWLQKTLN